VSTRRSVESQHEATGPDVWEPLLTQLVPVQ